MSRVHHINYIEFPVNDIALAKTFYSQVFGWEFVDFGAEYCSISNASIDAGFYLSEKSMSSDKGSALVVLYSSEIEESMKKVEAHGGIINKPLFEFPGGRRFHFIDPCGNEFAIWTDSATIS